MILMCFIGFLSACFTLFINYCIGKPGSKEFSPYEIFSSYTVWLSIKRLKNVDLYSDYMRQYNDNIQRTESRHEVITLKNDFKKMLYEAADPFFTWERAVGMCPVCTGVSISLIAGIMYLFFIPINLVTVIVTLLIIIVTSHITIRVLNKII